MGDGPRPPKKQSDVAPRRITDPWEGSGFGGAAKNGSEVKCWDVELSRTTELVEQVGEGTTIEGTEKGAEVVVLVAQGVLGFVTGAVASQILSTLADLEGSILSGQITEIRASECLVRICVFA